MTDVVFLKVSVQVEFAQFQKELLDAIWKVTGLTHAQMHGLRRPHTDDMRQMLDDMNHAVANSL